LRVLLVTYHFPPDAEIGSVRPFRLAKDLPEFGIEPWVLTVRPDFTEVPERGFEPEGVPEGRILRTEVATTHRDVVLDLWRRMSGIESGVGDPTAGAYSSPRPGGRRSAARERILAWLAFPDLRIGWYRPALRAGEELVARLSFDLIVSTSPPIVAHLVAARLAARHRLPWIMDFRDPWHMDGFVRLKSTLMRMLQHELFRRTARHASAVVANTPALLRHLEDRLPAPRARTVCIPNGFETNMVQGAAASEFPVDFSVGYLGSMVGQRSSLRFLQGLRLWLDRGADEGRVRVRYVGSGFAEEERAVLALRLGGVVSFAPRVPRREALELMAQQWVLLLLANDQPLQVPGKAYEYLATGRRVLALTERQGATSDLLRGVPGCEVAESAEEVVEALERLFQDYVNRAPGRLDRRSFLAENSYERRAEAFASLFRALTSSREAVAASHAR